jgi:hypothetical protein
MEPNPFESPREVGSPSPVSWRRVFNWGLIAFVGSLAIIAFTATFSYLPEKHPDSPTVHLAILNMALLGMLGGALAVAVSAFFRILGE